MNGDQKPIDYNKHLYEQLDVQFALQAAGLGVWELGLKTNRVRWDDRCRELFGLVMDNDLSYERVIQCIHPEDVDRVNQAVQWALTPQSNGHYDQTFRTTGADDGQLRWVRLQGRAYFTPGGELHRLGGIAQEVTQQKTIQRQQRVYEAITASTPDLMYVFDLSYRFIYANQALLAMWGSTWEASIGKGLRENGYEPWHAQMHEREIDQVVATKLSVRGEVSFPHATLGKRIYDYVFAPVLNEQGEVEAVAGTTRDITDIKQALQRIDESQRQLLALFEQSPVALATISADDQLVFEWANSFYGELVARPPQALVGKPLLEALPEINGQGFDAILKNVISTGTPFIGPEVAVNSLRDGQLTTIYINLTYQPRKGVDGTVVGILVVATDISQQVLARRKIEESEARFRALVEQAPVAVALFEGPQFVITSANERVLEYWGRQREQVMDKPLFEALPEASGQGFEELLTGVLTTGERFVARELSVMLERNGQLERTYIDFVYEPFRSIDGRIAAVMVVANEITEQVVARQKLAASEARFRTLIREAPVAMLVYEGPDQVMVEANQEMLEVFGRGEAIVGKPVLEAVPELKNTNLPRYYRRVLATGEPYHHPAERVLLIRNGQPYWGYYNYSYKPLYNEVGTIYGVICTSINVTAQVEAQQALMASETQLQNAVDLAELATWQVDVTNGQVTYSERYHEWMGLGQQTRIEHAFGVVDPQESARVEAAYQQAISPESTGLLDVEFSVTNVYTGKTRLIHIVGQTQRDEQGQPVAISGFAQDVTQLRSTQLALESLVRERTRELAVSIADLQEANNLLVRSNNNLQTFSYVASHDLQEPLRKIQQFGDLLRARLADTIGNDELGYLERMQGAAGRMSTLLRDLLSYSRISTQRSVDEFVSLNDVISGVLDTLELAIQEVDAKIDVEGLPILAGDALQLGQLFQNLLANALKFRRPGVAPRIHISSQLVAAADLPPTIKPSRRTASYERIEVADNGIGFEEKYLDRIFQVFQRLHGKNQYAGTGVGLAICEKVVTNHGGVLTASSQPGQGAAFTIYLPV